MPERELSTHPYGPPAAPRPGWRDGVCIAWLVLATVYLAPYDGGKELHGLLPALLSAPLVMIAARSSLVEASPGLRWGLLIWVAAPLLGFVFADVRAGWVSTVAVAALAVPLVLVGLHLLGRAWGPQAILLAAALSGLYGWYWGGLVWYGGGSNPQGEPAWMALSWHNQSGAFMGALGVGALALAVSSAGAVRVTGAVTVAAAGLSGAWLSGSRGAVLASLLGIGVVGFGAVRRSLRGRPGPSERLDPPGVSVGSVAVRCAAVLVLTAAGVLTLSGGYGGVGAAEQPVLARSQGAAANASVRVAYWSAALGMVRDAPLTGTGPGSYKWSSHRHFPDETGPTASAHNEQLEMWAELGPAGGAAALLLTGAVLVLSMRTILRRRGTLLDLAAAGVGTLLVTHAAIDFDWDYPILFALLILSTTVLLAAPPDVDGGPERRDVPDVPAAAHRPPPSGRGASVGRWVLLAGSTALAWGAAAGILIERGPALPPWELDRRMFLIAEFLRNGDTREAEELAADARRWNPGADRLPMAEALLQHADGRLSHQALAASVAPRRTAFSDQVLVAERLLAAGRADLASGVLDRMRPVLEDRRRWRVEGPVAQVTLLALDLAYEAGGCAAVGERQPEIRAWAAGLGVRLTLTGAPAPEGESAPSWQSCLAPATSS